MSLTLLQAAQAKLEGKRVEVSYQQDNWCVWDGLLWAVTWQFRIAPTTKKVKYLCWTNGPDLMWKHPEAKISPYLNRIPSEDKEVEIEQP